MQRYFPYYFLVTISFLGILWLLNFSSILPGKNKEIFPASKTEIVQQELRTIKTEKIKTSSDFTKRMEEPLAILLLQLVTIVLTARIVGIIFQKLGQPMVIGEILAGIMLGPTLLGKFFPEIASFLFPLKSLPTLQSFSQIGLVLFMFIIGMELDIKAIKFKVAEASVISYFGTVFPMIVGTILAFFLFSEFAPPSVKFLHFSLFLGISLSITAFPVLARILHERELTRTPLGAMAITCAAIGDILAWFILASIIAIVQAGNILGVSVTIGLTIIFFIFMWFVIKPLLTRAGTIYVSKENMNKTVVTFVVLLFLISAYITEILGVHALFGAFIAGTIMPSNLNFKKLLSEKIEDISLVLFLPLFFVFTGLRTQIGLLNDWHLWKICILIILAATLAKFGSIALISKITKQSWKNSLLLGALMNSRGLIELVVINIGYDLGILSPELFAMLVIMAIFTTITTSPSISLINFIFRVHKTALNPNTRNSQQSILISFAQPKMGSILLTVSSSIVNRQIDSTKFTALHCTPSSDVSYKDVFLFESEGFSPIRRTAQQLQIPIETRYKIANDVGHEIIETYNRLKYNLVLVGAAKRLFSKDLLGGTIKDLLDKIGCCLGILIVKDFSIIKRVLVILQNEQDIFLLPFGKNLINNKNTKIVINDLRNLFQEKHYFFTDYKDDDNYEVITDNDKYFTYINRFDMVIISHNFWKEHLEKDFENIDIRKTILVMRPRLELNENEHFYST